MSVRDLSGPSPVGVRAADLEGRCGRFATPRSRAPMKKNSQLARQLKLIDRLHATQGVTADQLAAELDCSRRTVYRDLNVLDDAGFDVLLDRGESTYALAPHYGFVPPPLGREELLAMVLAFQTTPLRDEPVLSGILDQVLGKLFMHVPLDQREQVMRVVLASAIPCKPIDQHASAMLRSIVAALAGATLIRVNCDLEDGRQISHDRICPVALYLQDDGWAFGYRASSENEVVVVPLKQVVSVQLAEPSAPNFYRHLLSSELNE